jgi:hypothetical protein
MYQINVWPRAARFRKRKTASGRRTQCLAPFAGRPAVAGVAVSLGPADLYLAFAALAFAALAFGDVVLAARHADAAQSLCQKWGIVLVGEWLRERRSQLGIER